MTRRARLADVARQAGVSPATASRALSRATSSSTLVADATAARVRAVALSLGYRPDVAARRLRTRRSMSVLLVVRDIGNPFYLEVLRGVEAEARAAGYGVLMGNTEDDAARESEYVDMLLDGHADAMILMTGKSPVSSGGEDAGDLPIVVALEPVEDRRYAGVHIDNRRAAREAVEHLLELGHRRVAHVSGPVPEPMSVLRRAGWSDALRAAGLDAAEPVRGDYTLAGGERAAREALRRRPRPTALFVANDEMAWGAMRAARALGLDVPKDVSIVGFDDLAPSAAFDPPLTTVSQPRAAIGRHAMRLLLDRLGGEADDPPVTLVLPTVLVVRGSTAPPPPADKEPTIR